MTLASSRKSVGLAYHTSMFFGRISHTMKPLPFIDFDPWISRLIIPCSLRQTGIMAPDFPPVNHRIVHGETRQHGSAADRAHPPATPWTHVHATSRRDQVIISPVYAFRRRSIPVPSCLLEILIHSTHSPTQSRPTRVFRPYRPTSPPSLQARE